MGTKTGGGQSFELILLKDGTAVGIVTELNLKAGTNVTLDAVMASVQDKIAEITINASGGSGSPSSTVTDETTFGVSPAAGSSTDYSRGDHTHGSEPHDAHGNLTGVTADQHHAQSHTHASHTGIGADDHHAQAHSGSDHTDPGSPSQIDVGDAASAGTGANAPASDDHQHALPAPATGYPVDVAATEADGTATTVARADHRHAHGSGYAGGHSDYPSVPSAGTTPVQIDIGDAQAGGADATYSKNDHQHAFPAPAGGYPVNVDDTDEADGTATTAARSDHKHSLRMRVEDEGVAQGTGFHTLDFTGAGVTVTATGQQANISIPGGSGSFTITEVEKNLGSSPTWRGKFNVVDASVTTGSKVSIWQAPGPYTGKGTRTDEAEMDRIECIAKALSGSFDVYWRSVEGYTPGLVHIASALGPGTAAHSAFGKDMVRYSGPEVLGRVKGNFKFHYAFA